MAYMVVEIYCATAVDTVINRIDVPSGSPGCLTCTTDLPVGDHEIFLRLSTPGGTGGFAGATMQVVVGQTVDEVGCRPIPDVPECS